MEFVKIYDRTLAETGFIGSFPFLSYTKEFRGAGDARLTVPADAPAADLLIPDGYIAVPDGTLYRIRKVTSNMRDGTVTADCDGLLALLSGTVIPMEYRLTGAAADLLCILAKRAIGRLPASFTTASVTGSDSVTFSSGRSYLYDDLVSLCRHGGLGMTVTYDGTSLVFAPVLPKDRTASSADPVTFSGQMGTAESEESVWDLSGYRNVASVSGGETDSGGRYTATVRADELDFGDLFPDEDYFDRQMLVTFSAPMSGYKTADGAFDEAAYTADLIAAGEQALRKCRPKLCLTGQTDTDALTPGDLITVRDPESGITGTALAERITTVYKNNTRTVKTELITTTNPV